MSYQGNQGKNQTANNGAGNEIAGQYSNAILYIFSQHEKDSRQTYRLRDIELNVHLSVPYIFGIRGLHLCV
jgi:hypothetical protein